MTSDPETDSRPTPRFDAIARWAIVLLILLMAGVLRFSGLNWDLAQWIHPDEGHMRAVTGAVSWPADLGDYFDTRASSLNPRNNDQVYSYGTLPLFATRALAEWMEDGCGQPVARLGTPASLNARLARWLLARVDAPVHVPCPPGTFTWTYNAFLGRHLAALADLGTVLLVYLIGRRLYGEAMGLVAMGLAAFTALMVQQAHFYTVDSPATFFTALTALFAVRASRARRPPWLDLSLAGVATGLATGCKVSAAVAAGLVALGALAWVLRRTRDAGHHPDDALTLPRAIAAIALPVALAGLLSLVAFRTTQPYAFEGPGFFGFRLNQEWFDRLEQIGEEQSGLLDYPSGRQWTNRWPVLFPWLNIVVWGMGLPLGLTAWIGWALMGAELARGVRRHLILWPWTTAYFAFYATRWVKAMRYFLPIYPLLILMAAYGLVRLVASGVRTTSQRRHLVGLVTAACVIVSTAAWGLGVFTLYRRPHTRIAASRWIYDNVPTGSVVANEHWDWGLPLRIAGRGGVSDGYIGLTMTLYDEDTPEKRAQLLEWLNQADYLFLASNRLYGSIPRLPDRYPLTTAYYRALFAGELGFELAAEFTSYPTLGPLTFPDQERPFPLMAPVTSTQGDRLPVPLPEAEESFSVYDHPDCLIFRKTDAYSPKLAASALGAVDLAQARIGQSPHDATPGAVITAHTVLFALGVALTTGVVIAAIAQTPPSFRMESI
jgi:4-amino-4-deoxy-L-arabinose transferase-like glycosyltransferase